MKSKSITFDMSEEIARRRAFQSQTNIINKIRSLRNKSEVQVNQDNRVEIKRVGKNSSIVSFSAFD